MSYFKSESITSSLKNNFYILTNEKNKNSCGHVPVWHEDYVYAL